MKTKIGRNLTVGLAMGGLFALGFVVTSKATVIDLTTTGNTGSANGAQLLAIDPSSTGTGVIDPPSSGSKAPAARADQSKA